MQNRHPGFRKLSQAKVERTRTLGGGGVDVSVFSRVRGWPWLHLGPGQYCGLSLLKDYI